MNVGRAVWNECKDWARIVVDSRLFFDALGLKGERTNFDEYSCV